MPFNLSGAALRHLTGELRSRLVGSRLDNLYQLDPKTFLFRLKDRDRRRQQLLLPLAGLPHLNPGTFTTPSTPSLAAQILRKHLRDAILADIEQSGLDRIMWLYMERQGSSIQLVLELFRQGNLLLVQDGILIWVLKPRTYRHRTLRVGQAYRPPPQGIDPSDLDQEGLVKLLQGEEGPLELTLARALNLGPQPAREVVAGCGLDPRLALVDLDLERLWNISGQIIELIDPRQTRPHLYLKGGKAVAAYPWASRLHPEAEAREIDSLCEAYAMLYETGMEVEREAAPDPITERWERKMAQQKEAIERYREIAARRRAEAEAIYANYAQVHQMLETLRQAVERMGWVRLTDEASELPGLARVDPARKEVEIGLGELQLTLKVEDSVEANADRIYGLAKRAESKAQGAQIAKKGSERLTPPPASSVDGDPPKTERIFWFERFRWFVTSTGNVGVAGRDAASNETIVRRYLKSNDVYCHADLTGAPSVVVKHQQGEVPENAALEGCLYSLAYSKAWSARVASGHSYWAEADQVSKTPQTGEFLAKGAFVIRGRRHWHRNQAVEAAVGWVDIEGVPKVMGGPVPALQALSSRYVVLRPGYRPRREVVRILAAALGCEAGALERVLPPGDCDLLRSEGLDLNWSDTD